MRILFTVGSGTNGRLRAEALRALGHEVEVLDYSDLTPFPERRLLQAMRLGPAGWLDRFVSHCLARNPALQGSYDLAFLNQPKIFGPRCYDLLRKRAGRLVNYINDDPFGNSDDAIWRLFLKTVPQNDLVVVSRDVNVPEARALGARRVIRVNFPADETLHRPLPLTEEDREQWGSEVLFMGTCFPERGPFIRELIERGVPVAIYGNAWSECPEWPVIRPHFRSRAIKGEGYVKAVQCAKIAIGLLSKGNRDLHTLRSMEIPAVGTLLCAERTEEHRRMYEEGKEAVFFDDAAECAALCLELLDDDARREQIAAAGHRRFLATGTTNRSMLKQILEALEDAESAAERVALG